MSDIVYRAVVMCLFVCCLSLQDFLLIDKRLI